MAACSSSSKRTACPPPPSWPGGSWQMAALARIVPGPQRFASPQQAGPRASAALAKHSEGGLLQGANSRLLGEPLPSHGGHFAGRSTAGGRGVLPKPSKKTQQPLLLARPTTCQASPPSTVLLERPPPCPHTIRTAICAKGVKRQLPLCALQAVPVPRTPPCPAAHLEDLPTLPPACHWQGAKSTRAPAPLPAEGEGLTHLANWQQEEWGRGGTPFPACAEAAAAGLGPSEALAAAQPNPTAAEPGFPCMSSQAG